MMIVMEMSAGKVLDEVCNHYNDAYSDEVLYTSRMEFPQVEARLEEVVTTETGESARADADRFMAHLFACRG